MTHPRVRAIMIDCATFQRLRVEPKSTPELRAARERLRALTALDLLLVFERANVLPCLDDWSFDT